mmetsp:Transcript_29871/g.71201  ORF Transcript_29871/g.71201 Transcript_29871/m.71201 type:complete len:295 (+) Transcript_29871:545-1429(+)
MYPRPPTCMYPAQSAPRVPFAGAALSSPGVPWRLSGATSCSPPAANSACFAEGLSPGARGYAVAFHAPLSSRSLSRGTGLALGLRRLCRRRRLASGFVKLDQVPTEPGRNPTGGRLKGLCVLDGARELPRRDISSRCFSSSSAVAKMCCFSSSSALNSRSSKSSSSLRLDALGVPGTLPMKEPLPRAWLPTVEGRDRDGVAAVREAGWGVRAAPRCCSARPRRLLWKSALNSPALRTMSAMLRSHELTSSAADRVYSLHSVCDSTYQPSCLSSGKADGSPKNSPGPSRATVLAV